MKNVPSNILTLAEAAQKYGFHAASLRNYVKRGRLEAIKKGKTWYTTDKAVRKYLRIRDTDKIPNRYRGKKK